MSLYQNVLVAVDLSDESRKIANKAMEIVGGNEQSLTFVFVLEALATAYPLEAYSVDTVKLQQNAVEAAGSELSTLVQELGVPNAKLFTSVGSPAAEIRDVASKVGADLIVLGSHGTSGWRLLLGSTANSVLHGAQCDVLTVKVEGE